MPRSTHAQKAERLNAAHRLLARGTSMAEAAVTLSRNFAISRRQAYRYLQEAQEIGHLVAIAEPSQALTLKIPDNVARELRAYAARSELTLSEIASRAIAGFLASVRRHG